MNLTQELEKQKELAIMKSESKLHEENMLYQSTLKYHVEEIEVFSNSYSLYSVLTQ